MVRARPGGLLLLAGGPGLGCGAIVRREDQENLLDSDPDAKPAAAQARPEGKQPDSLAEPESFPESEAQSKTFTIADSRGRRDAQAEEEEKILSHSLA